LYVQNRLFLARRNETELFCEGTSVNSTDSEQLRVYHQIRIDNAWGFVQKSENFG